jgi:hypothetical protein
MLWCSRLPSTSDEDATSCHQAIDSISVDVDAGECSSATEDADAASPMTTVGEDVARKEGHVTVPDMDATTPIT